MPEEEKAKEPPRRRLARAALETTARELGAQLLHVLPHSELQLVPETQARDQWRSLVKGEQQPSRLFWDPSSQQVWAFLFDSNRSAPSAGLAITPVQSPHENDIRFLQIFCRVFNEDLRTAPDARTQRELWDLLSGTRFARSIGRFSPFSTLPFMHWLRTIESAADLRYGRGGFSATIFVVRKRKWITGAAKIFVPFSRPLSFESALSEKWIRSLAAETGVGLVALGHEGAITGVVAIPRRQSKAIIPPHRTLGGAVSLVHPGSMAFLCSPNGDLYIVLSNGGMFLKTHGRWHYVNYLSFRNLLRQHVSKRIVDSVLRTILDLSYQRRGALLCFLDDNRDVTRVVPDHGRAGRVNTALREAVRSLDIRRGTDQEILIAAAAIDGATVFSSEGRVLDSACIIGEPDQAALSRFGIAELSRFPGARSTAAWNASLFGLSVKISEDGPVTVYRGGNLIGQMG